VENRKWKLALKAASGRLFYIHELRTSFPEIKVLSKTVLPWKKAKG
jgi:hypothetical protein